MVRSFVEAILGDVGRQILYFYEANSCLINSIVLTYGVFMFAAWNNLVRIYRFLIIEVAKKVHEAEDLNLKTTNKQIRESVEIPWESAIELSTFPLVARLGAVIPKRNTVENLKIYFDEKDLVEKAIRVLKGENVRKMAPMSRKLLQRELAIREEARKNKS